MTHDTARTLAAPAILALGLSLGGFAAGQGFVQSRRADRFVTVKGVSEREVEADLALWPLSVSVADDDLAVAQGGIDAAVEHVVAFLGSVGIDGTALTAMGVQVTDRATERFGEFRAGQKRYVVTHSVMVRTADLDAIDAASAGIGRLLETGVSLSTPDGWGYSRPTYVFTRLNDLKPSMIAEATASAREAAERFAEDSRSRLGGIRRANQGVFEILPRDAAPGIEESTQRHKRVRVVSTVEYFLEG